MPIRCDDTLNRQLVNRGANDLGENAFCVSAALRKNNGPMVDILLIQPPIHDFYLTAKRTIPYGLIQVAEALRDAGFTVDILDGLATDKSTILPLPPELAHLRRFYPDEDLSPFSLFYHFKHFGYSFEHLGLRAKASGAFLIGISALFTPYSNTALQTAQSVRSFHPSGRIVLGGHHATALPKHLMTSPAVDYVLRGDGEVSMPKLAAALTNGSDLRSVPGLVFRKADGRLHVGPPAYMQTLSLPAGKKYNHPYYRRHKRGSAVVVTSRGCPLKCSYCAMGRAAGAPYRRRSVKSVLSEIDHYVHRAKVGFIDFEDENLTLHKPWVMQLLKQIHIRYAGADLELRAMNGLYPPSLDRQIIAAMAAAGFTTINLSVGSTSAEQQKRFGRKDVRKAFDDALHWAGRFGLDAVGYVIAAAPFQQPSDSIEDLIFLAQRRVLAGLSIYYPAPGSSDYDLCRRLDLLPPHAVMMRASALPVEHTTSRLEAATLLRLARITNFIKYLIDNAIDRPSPRWPPADHALADKSRLEIGLALLAGYFSDGKIRGINPDGHLYEQPVSEPLSRLYLRRLAEVNIKGSC